MLYYIIAAIIIGSMFAALAFPEKRKQYASVSVRQKNDLMQWYLIAILFVMTSVVAFQKEVVDVGDIERYKYSYEYLRGLSFSGAVEWARETKDPIYYILSYIFAKAGLGFAVWRTFIEGFFCFGIYKLVSKYSSNIPISVMVILSLELYGFTLTGLRQTCALSILLFSYGFLVNKKLIKFCGVVLLASLFHSSAIVFMLAYPCFCLKPGFRSVCIMGGICASIMIFFKDILYAFVSIIETAENYSSYLEGTTKLTFSGTIIYGCILFFVTVFLYFGKTQTDDKRLCHLLMISLVFRIMSSLVFAEMFRIAMYFSLFDCITIASACTEQDDKPGTRIGTGRYLILLFVVLMFALYYITSPSYNIVNFRFV